MTAGCGASFPGGHAAAVLAVALRRRRDPRRARRACSRSAACPSWRSLPAGSTAAAATCWTCPAACCMPWPPPSPSPVWPPSRPPALPARCRLLAAAPGDDGTAGNAPVPAARGGGRHGPPVTLAGYPGPPAAEDAVADPRDRQAHPDEQRPHDYCQNRRDSRDNAQHARHAAPRVRVAGRRPAASGTAAIRRAVPLPAWRAIAPGRHPRSTPRSIDLRYCRISTLA